MGPGGASTSRLCLLLWDQVGPQHCGCVQISGVGLLWGQMGLNVEAVFRYLVWDLMCGW